MRARMGFPILAFATLWVANASADPVTFQPDGCDFQLSFPAAPTPSQSKTQTSRGDTVVNDKAILSLDVDGKANYFRAECTRIPHMGFVDEAILTDNMRDLGDTYKLQNVITGIEHNGVAGPIGKLRGKGRTGGKDMVFEIRRYTSKADIFDVWIGADPDLFPSGANTEFLRSIKLNGQILQ
ncbi:MAG TPA: hypothetical protein VNW15_11405 [Rhizomicrobium sp.]|nr:hypothetical protein [Rhizomicrobium sp.]